jgi:hypothetical protein
MAQNDCLFFLMEEHIECIIIGQDAGSLRSEVCDHSRADGPFILLFTWCGHPGHTYRNSHGAGVSTGKTRDETIQNRI